MPANFHERIRPVDPDRFRFALGVYQAAAALKGPFPNPASMGVNLEDADGPVSRLTFTDIPENRGVLAIKKEFPDHDEFQSMAFRVLSFGEVLRDGKLRKWELVKDREDGGTDVHDAVIHAVAQAPYRKSGHVDWVALRTLAKTEFDRIEREDSQST